MSSPTKRQKMSKSKEVTFDDLDQMPYSSISVSNMSWNKTGSWRSVRPVLDDDVCISCMRCWKSCPDISISIKGEKPIFDYTYCKGCGICARECPVDAITLEREVK